jgi:hypothetical protein
MEGRCRFHYKEREKCRVGNPPVADKFDSLFESVDEIIGRKDRIFAVRLGSWVSIVYLTAVLSFPLEGAFRCKRDVKRPGICCRVQVPAGQMLGRCR